MPNNILSAINCSENMLEVLGASLNHIFNDLKQREALEKGDADIDRFIDLCIKRYRGVKDTSPKKKEGIELKQKIMEELPAFTLEVLKATASDKNIQALLEKIKLLDREIPKDALEKILSQPQSDGGLIIIILALLTSSLVAPSSCEDDRNSCSPSQ